MTQLSGNDFSTLSSALEEVYGIACLEEFPTKVLSATKQLFHCNTLCYNEITLPNSMTIWITEPSSALPSPTLRDAFMRNFTEHPALAHYAQSGNSRSYRISDFISCSQFHNLTLYNEYYKKSSVEYQMVTALMLAPNRMVGLALDRDCTDFSENERACLDLLRPHLMQAYRNAQTIDIMRRGIEEENSILLIVSRCGQVRLASDNTWRLIARYFDVKNSGNVLPEMLNNWIRYERSRFSNKSDIPSPSVPLILEKETGKLTIRFLWGGIDAEHDLVLMEEETPTLFKPSEEFGLTRRETEILTWLALGKTNPEIGLTLSISPRTVKKHMEHIYSKLNVHRRSGAVACFLQR